jgi:hypothetical protein
MGMRTQCFISQRGLFYIPERATGLRGRPAVVYKFADGMPPETYFLMTNGKGDYGCMTFTDYGTYLQSLETYTRLGWVDVT